MKKSAYFLAEVLGFTLIVKALASPLFGLPLNSTAAQVSMWFAFGVLTLLLAWIFNKLLRGWGARDLGFRYYRNFGTDVWLGVCGFAVSNVCSVPFDIAALADRANMAHGIVGEFHLTSPLQIFFGGIALATTLGFFTGAFHEEIRFRGYYQGAGAYEIAPLAGLLIGLIPFSLGHYYAQPDWSVAQVLATLIPGIVYGLLFHVTRSLTVVMTTHTLTNVLPFIPFLLHEMTGSRVVTLASLIGLAVLSLVLIALRWNNEFRVWREPTRKLFTDRPGLGVISGVVIGLALLALWPRQFRPIYSTVAGATLFAIALAGKTFGSLRQHQDTNRPIVG